MDLIRLAKQNCDSALLANSMPYGTEFGGTSARCDQALGEMLGCGGTLFEHVGGRQAYPPPRGNSVQISVYLFAIALAQSV